MSRAAGSLSHGPPGSPEATAGRHDPNEPRCATAPPAGKPEAAATHGAKGARAGERQTRRGSLGDPLPGSEPALLGYGSVRYSERTLRRRLLSRVASTGRPGAACLTRTGRGAALLLEVLPAEGGGEALADDAGGGCRVLQARVLPTFTCVLPTFTCALPTFVLPSPAGMSTAYVCT